MIDIKNAEEEFIKYTQKFNLDNENIKGKQIHSIRVMRICNQIAKKLGLSDEQVDIATLIGLLHDIARFEQYTQFRTFKDLESFDHGDWGVQILDKDIRKYIQTDKYDNIIKIAIRNHNKFEIEQDLSKEELLFSRIIRDADKIDIMFESTGVFWKGQENLIENSKVSEDILIQFKNKHLVKRRKDVSIEYIDSIISIIAFIYDINFIPSFEIISRNDYINKIFNRFKFRDKNTLKQIEEVRDIANTYIKLKLNEDV